MDPTQSALDGPETLPIKATKPTREPGTQRPDDDAAMAAAMDSLQAKPSRKSISICPRGAADQSAEVGWCPKCSYCGRWNRIKQQLTGC